MCAISVFSNKNRIIYKTMASVLIDVSTPELFKRVLLSAEAQGCACTTVTENSQLVVVNPSAQWLRSFQNKPWFRHEPYRPAHPRFLQPLVSAAASISYTGKEYASIYGFPSPSPSNAKVIAVVSFGGGLVGTTAPKRDGDDVEQLVSGDVFTYWESTCGISPSSMPRVAVYRLPGADTSASADVAATAENTLDVEMIGACCPNPDLTILLYIAPNTIQAFIEVFRVVTTQSRTLGGVALTPDVVSVSWGTPEITMSSTQMNVLNTIFAASVARGVNICCASGDNGSSDGTALASCADFPSSSPNVVACGGTKLQCPSKTTYDASTVETTWSLGGGAVSRQFAKPAYQSQLAGAFRHTPDLALNADPSTGVQFRVFGSSVVYGGTSIVAPAVAAYLTLLNYKTFVHPRLYAYISRPGFYDIVSGSNGAYSAGVSFDNCTGLGSINGSRLSDLLLAAYVPVTGVSIQGPIPDPIISRLPFGFTLSCTVSPADATDSSVKWSTSNPAVATVQGSGTVTVVGRGVAVISVKTNDGQYTATYTVNSNVATPGVLSIVRPASTTLLVGGTLTLSLQVRPTVVNWSSSKPSVLTVHSTSGAVLAKSGGSATVTVTAPGYTPSSIVLTVLPVPTSLQISGPSSVSRKGSVTLTAVPFPTGSQVQSIVWSTSAPSNVTVTVLNKTQITVVPKVGSKPATIAVRASAGGGLIAVKTLSVL